MKIALPVLALLPMALLMAPLSRAHADAPAPAPPAPTEKWSLLRSKNSNVEDGNQRLLAGDAKGALAAYDRAARELPSEGGVHLNRGLALLRSGDLPKARDALHLGSQPPASADVRADAYYDLGITFYKEADQRAGEQKHDEAQKLFREAAESFKQALRKRPGDRNSAWNYELAARRIREQEEEQKKQEEEQKKQDQQKQDQQKQDQQNPDQQKQDQQKQDQAKNDQQKPEQKPQDQQGKQDQQQQQQQQQADAQQQPPAPRPEVDRALDALQDGEENLERLRAMNRAAAERRKPDKDW
jgi:Ca-activated chloride channel family protein